MYERRHLYAINVHIPEYVEYTGSPVERKNWISDEEFCLSDPTQEGGYRILRRENILHGWRHSERNVA
jgi:hypothetical protein